MDFTQNPNPGGFNLAPCDAPELVLGKLLSHIHRLATMHPIGHFHQVCCEELASTLSIGSWYWFESSHAYRGKKAILQWTSPENAPVRELREQVIGTEGNHDILLGLSDTSPDLGDAFWQALLQSLVHLRDNLGLSLVSSALNTPDDAASALVSTDGTLVDAAPAFFDYIRSELPDWSGTQLPHGILSDDNRDTNDVVWRSLYIHIMEDDGYLRLLAHRDRRQSTLTARELEIADYIARGCTFKQTGIALGISPSTAASHLYNIYAKLGIGRRSELVEWMQAHSQGLHGAGKPKGLSH